MSGLADHLRATIADNVCLCPPSHRKPERVRIGALVLTRCGNCSGYINRPCDPATITVDATALLHVPTEEARTRALLRDLLAELTTQPLWNEGARGEQIQALTDAVEGWHP